MVSATIRITITHIINFHFVGFGPSESKGSAAEVLNLQRNQDGMQDEIDELKRQQASYAREQKLLSDRTGAVEKELASVQTAVEEGKKRQTEMEERQKEMTELREEEEALRRETAEKEQKLQERRQRMQDKQVRRIFTGFAVSSKWWANAYIYSSKPWLQT
jgi:type IV secretory pathway VirB10-like protein